MESMTSDSSGQVKSGEKQSEQVSDEHDKITSLVADASQVGTAVTVVPENKPEMKSGEVVKAETAASPIVAASPAEATAEDAKASELVEKSTDCVEAETALAPSSDAAENTKESSNKKDEMTTANDGKKVVGSEKAGDASADHESEEYEHRDAPDFPAIIRDSGMKQY